MLVGIAAVSYAGELGHETAMPAEPNLADKGASEMFAFLRTHTPEDVLVFPKPRTLALFTERRVAARSPEQSKGQSLAFLRAIHATVVFEAEWGAGRTAHTIGTVGSGGLSRRRIPSLTDEFD